MKRPGVGVNQPSIRGRHLGLAPKLDEESIGTVILGDRVVSPVEEGGTVGANGRILSAPSATRYVWASTACGPRRWQTAAPMRRMAGPGIAGRQPVHEPMGTGIAIDAMTPIGWYSASHHR